MQELSEASELSQRAIYADVRIPRSLDLSADSSLKQIFGFKYNLTHAKKDMDPDEQTAARYRLFARAIKIIGLSQIASLLPFLQSRLEKTVSDAMRSRGQTDGIWNFHVLLLLLKRAYAT